MTTSPESVTIRFVVQVTQHPIFEEPFKIYVVGNIAELGNWNPEEGTEMGQSAEERFEASIIVPKYSKNIESIIEYKYVTFSKEKDREMHWEHGENRFIQKIDSAFLQIQDQYRDAVPRHSKLPKEYFSLDRFFGRTPEQKISSAVPTNDEVVLVRFLVSAGTYEPNHQIGVLGTCDEIGNELAKARTLQYTYPNWELDLYVPRKCFPVEYKYAYLEERSYLEDGQNNRIDLPVLTSTSALVVQLNDVFRPRYYMYSCMTTINAVQSILEYSNYTIIDLIYLEDDKLVVGSQNALHHYLKLGKNKRIIIKKIRKLFTFNINYGSEVETLYEALIDPECSIRKIRLKGLEGDFNDKQLALLSEILQKNQTITSIVCGEEIEDGYEEEQDQIMPIDWLLDGLAKNIYPRIQKLVIELHPPWSLELICRSLKTNTSLKELEMIAISYNRQDVQLHRNILQALKDNDSLTAVTLTRIRVKSMELVQTIHEKRNIQSLTISTSEKVHGDLATRNILSLVTILRQLHFSTTRFLRPALIKCVDDLKHSKTISRFSLQMPYHPVMDYKSLIEELFESNWTLVDLGLYYWKTSETTKIKELIEQKCERNRQFQIQRHDNIIMTLFNIGRSKEALTLLPREIWLHIFSYIESSLGYDYCLMLAELFKDRTTVHKLAPADEQL